MRILACLTIIGFVPEAANSAPSNPHDYIQAAGGFVDLPRGSYVEGSTKFGGIQPDYKIADDPDLDRFLAQVQKAVSQSKKIKLFEWLHLKNKVRAEKIAIVTDLVRAALPHYQYRSEPYLDVVEKYRREGIDINLGSYLQCKAGVCRENALLTHFALKAVGVANKVGYVHATRDSVASEDHAIVVIEKKGEQIIVDPYNDYFHGRKLSEAMARATPARIVRINSYPVYWIPRRTCSGIFTSAAKAP